MTSIGAVVMILAIGLLIFVLLRGGCCGRQDNHRDQAGAGPTGGPGPETKKQRKGGCCG